MKKLIYLLIFISSFTASQNQLYDWWYLQNGSAKAGIYCGTIDLTTGVPYVPYDDFYLQFTPPQVARMWHYNEWQMSDTITHWRARWDMKMSVLSGTQVVWGQSSVASGFIENISTRIIGSNVKLYIGDTNWVIFPTDLNWHTYDIIYDNGLLTSTVDDTLRYTYPTTMPNVPGTSYAAFSWGTNYVQTGSGYQAIITPGGIFNGAIDNCFLQMEDSTFLNTNYNQGATNQPQDSTEFYLLDRAKAPHGWKGNGMWLGSDEHTTDFYDPQYFRRSGDRKDTLKYYSVGDFSVWHNSVAGPERRTIGKVDVSPYDSTKVMMHGVFNKRADSSISTSIDIALWNGTDWDSLGSGLDASGDFPNYGAWWKHPTTDTIYYFVLHQGDSAGGKPAKYIAGVNVAASRWFACDTLPAIGHELRILNDTLYVHLPTKIMGYDLINGIWHTDHTFTGAGYGEVLGIFHNQLIAARDDSGIFVRNGVDNYVLTYPITGTFAFAYGTFFEDPVEDVLWGSGFGLNCTLGGVAINNIWYIKNGTVTNPGGGIDGFIRGSTSLDTYGNSAYDITRWNNVIVAVGFWRNAGGVPASSLAFYDYNTNEWCPIGYPPSFGCFGVTTYKTLDGYQDLMVCGDFDAAGGVQYSSVFGVYTPERFKTLTPIISVTTIPENIDPIFWPPSITLSASSPSRRAITITCDYIINDIPKSFTFSKTDSSLINTKGYWTYNWSGTFGAADTLVLDDTIPWTVTVLDDYGHTWDTSNSFIVATMPDYADLESRMDTLPNSTRRDLIKNTMLKFYDSLGISRLNEKFEVLVFLAADHLSTAKLNWVSSSYDAVLVGTSTFAVDTGLTGNGTTGCINTGFTPKNDSSIFKLDFASVGIYCRSDIQETKYDVSSQDATSYTTLLLRYSGGLVFNLNSVLVNDLTAYQNSRAMWIDTRTIPGGGNYKLYRNGIELATGVQFSSTLTAYPFYVGARNASSSIGFFTTKQYSNYFFGAGFTATESRKVSNIINWYMTQLNVNIY